MAFSTHGNTETVIRQFGTPVQIPDSPTGRLRYYFDTVCGLLDIQEDSELLQLIRAGREPALAELRNYSSERDLTRAELRVLWFTCMFFSPDELIGTVFIQDDKLCGFATNKLIALSTLVRHDAITEGVVIAGQRQAVTTIMAFKPIWLFRFWIAPMRFCLPDSDELHRKIGIIRQMVPSVILLESSVEFRPRLAAPNSTCCTLL